MHPILANIFSALGLTDKPAAATKRDTRQPNSTKAGPGRKHLQGDGARTAQQKRAGAFGRGLRNSINRANALRTAKRLAREQAIAYGRTPRPN